MQLRALELEDPKGDVHVSMKNDNKWKEILLPLLVDKQTMIEITGGPKQCSKFCLKENGDEEHQGYKLLDGIRFQQSGCSHFTKHL